ITVYLKSGVHPGNSSYNKSRATRNPIIPSGEGIAMKTTGSLRAALAFTLALTCAAGAVLAQVAVYPDRPIKLLVGFGAGGGTDIVARMLAPEMSNSLVQSVVVENRTGASGMIAAADVAKSPPDGYTLMMGTQTIFAVGPILYRKTVTLDPAKD